MSTTGTRYSTARPGIFKTKLAGGRFVHRLMAIAQRCEEPAIAARLRSAVGLSPDADLVVQFGDNGDEDLPSPLRAIRAALTADGDDHLILDDLRASLLTAAG